MAYLPNTHFVEPDNVLYTKAAIALHNFLRTTEPSIYCPSSFTDSEDVDGNIVIGSWQEEQDSGTCLQPVHQTGSNHHSLSAANVRDYFCQYFNSPEGVVVLQYQHVRRTN